MGRAPPGLLLGVPSWGLQGRALLGPSERAFLGRSAMPSLGDVRGQSGASLVCLLVSEGEREGVGVAPPRPWPALLGHAWLNLGDKRACFDMHGLILETSALGAKT